MSLFCSQCGGGLADDAKFCAGCGAPVGPRVPLAQGASAPPQVSPSAQAVTPEERDLWEGSPDPVLSPVGARTVKYRITTQRLIVDHGLVGKSQEQIPLFRVKDVQVKKSLVARTRGVGTIIVTSTDPTTPALKLEHIDDVAHVADMLGKLVLDARRNTNVFAFNQ
jgi:Bacterial PH domain